jgi:protein SCO1/2
MGILTAACSVLVARLAVACTVILLAACSGVSRVGEHASQHDAAVPIRNGQAAPGFELIDSHGDPFTEEGLRGKWTLLFFGYTHCPDYCPTTLSTIAAAYRGWERTDPGVAGRVQVVFVSLDPFRDTPGVLQDFIAYFDPRFIAATGEPAKLKRLTRFLGIYYAYSDPDSGAIINDTERRPPGEYGVEHSAVLLLFDERAVLRARLAPPATRERLDGVFDMIRAATPASR